MALRTATADDWRQITGLDEPGHWIGLAYEEGGAVLGLGGIYEGVDGRWWATLKANARRPVSVYKAALQLVDVARRAGVDLYSIPDFKVPGSVELQLRLGFRPSGEIIGGYEVYKWASNSH